MSTTAGAFNETRLLDFVVKAGEIAFDDRIKRQFIPCNIFRSTNPFFSPPTTLFLILSLISDTFIPESIKELKCAVIEALNEESDFV